METKHNEDISVLALIPWHCQLTYKLRIFFYTCVDLAITSLFKNTDYDDDDDEDDDHDDELIIMTRTIITTVIITIIIIITKNGKIFW